MSKLFLDEISGSYGGENENYTVFWDVASCSLVEVYRVSEVLTASIIRAVMGPDVRDSKHL
jgi:hypothetical protein